MVFAFRIALLVFAVIACSTAAVMIRASEIPPVLIGAYRLLIAYLLMAPAHFRARRRYPEISLGLINRKAFPAGILLMLHFWSWNAGLQMTTIANASLIVNLVPVAMPFIIWLMVRERVGRTEVVGTVLALGGTVLLVTSDYQLSLSHFLGDLTCFASMLALYLAWNRRAGIPGVWLYVPVVYLYAGLLCLLAGVVTGAPLVPGDPREWLLMLGLAVVPTMIGHTLLNVSMRTLRSQVVAITNIGQFIPAGILAWIFFSEKPSIMLPVCAVLVVAGALTAILGHREAPQPREAG